MTSLLYFIQHYTRYVGCFLLITGLVGNSINIYILSAVSSYRSTPSTFYFLIASICDIMVLLIALLSRILDIGYRMDLFNSSIIWCKLRNYFINSIGIIPFYCQLLATIDQYLATSKHMSLRRLSNIKLAYWNSLILTVICLLHGIPFYLYYNISPETQLCFPMNIGLSLYIPIYVLGLVTFIPCSLIILFGFLTYRNVSQSVGLTHQHADRQLVNMIRMQIILIILTTIPYGLVHLYGFSTVKIKKNTNRLNRELLVFTIISLNSYFYSGGSFFVFMASSSRFRTMVKKRIFSWFMSNPINVLR